jgi:uncharacterized protein (DUF302 family)
MTGSAGGWFSRGVMSSVVAGLLLLVSLPAVAADAATVTDYRKTYVTHGSFADVRDSVQLAITGRGIVINNVSHIGNMLARTAKDVGSSVQVYGQAEALEFCSSILSRKMMEADRHNIVFCPYIISVYTLPGETDRVYISYRRPQLVGSEASKQALREVEHLLDGIIDEAIQF